MYSVYILASLHRVIYIGVTGNLDKRMADHKSKRHPEGFAARYN